MLPGFGPAVGHLDVQPFVALHNPYARDQKAAVQLYGNISFKPIFLLLGQVDLDSGQVHAARPELIVVNRFCRCAARMRLYN